MAHQQSKKKENHFAQFAETMKGFMGGRAGMIEHHKKNIDTLTEANKMAVEVMKNVTHLQQQYIKQAFESMSSMMKEMMKQGAHQDSLQKHAEHLKEHMNRSIDHGANVAQTVTKSHKDIYETMKGRVTEHLEKMKENQQKTKH